VLETYPRNKEKKWRRNGSVQPKQHQPVAHRTVQCPGWPDGELAALGNRRGDVAKNHRTFRWCTGLSGESSTLAPKSSAINSSLSGKEKDVSAKIHRTVRWCTGLSGESTAPAANGRLRDQWATHGLAKNRMVAPDYPVCTRQCPVCQ
jgi:hypothetical protein